MTSTPPPDPRPRPAYGEYADQSAPAVPPPAEPGSGEGAEPGEGAATGDGAAPGEAAAPSAPPAPPAYGVFAEPSPPPPAAPPAYGEYSQPSAPPPAAPPAYGHYAPMPPASPQSPYAQAAAGPAAATGPAATGPERTGLGKVAMIVAIIVFVLSAIAATLIGVGEGAILKSAGTTLSDPNNINTSNAAAFSGVGLAIVVHLFLGTGLGVWALVQGIVAVAQRRGRAFGIVAICFAGAAPVLSLILYGIGIATQVPR